jgi:hypothetical protein
VDVVAVVLMKGHGNGGKLEVVVSTRRVTAQGRAQGQVGAFLSYVLEQGQHFVVGWLMVNVAHSWIPDQSQTAEETLLPV